MRTTIHNKLIWGFTGVLVLLTLVAGSGIYAVFNLRKSAQDATRVGGRLLSIALELQVHNLEAERRVKDYLLRVRELGPQKAREQYLEEAQFEVAAIESLAAQAVAIAPTADKREKFQKTLDGVVVYKKTLAAAVLAAENNSSSTERVEAQTAYENAAETLHENAEDAEVAGRDASRSSQQDINRTSTRSIRLAIGISLLGILLGAIVSFALCRAILIPVLHLKTVAENVSLGNLDIAVRRYSNDEIGDLADSFARMVTAVKFFRMEAEAVQAELPPRGSRD